MCTLQRHSEDKIKVQITQVYIAHIIPPHSSCVPWEIKGVVAVVVVCG